MFFHTPVEFSLIMCTEVRFSSPCLGNVLSLEYMNGMSDTALAYANFRPHVWGMFFHPKIMADEPERIFDINFRPHVWGMFFHWVLYGGVFVKRIAM